MVNIENLLELVAGSHEWLLVRESGPTFPLERGEIEITTSGGKVHFGFLDDKGFHSWRLNGFTGNGDEIIIDVGGSFARNRETMRLIPRVRASDLATEIELARQKKADEIANLIPNNFPLSKLTRVSLNEANGRLAQINFESANRVQMAAIYDVSGQVTIETLFTAAMLWVEKLGLRKVRSVNDIWVICERPQAKKAQKLHALLNGRWRTKITIIEIVRSQETPTLIVLPQRKISELWRERAAKLTLPGQIPGNAISRQFIDLAPDKIDVIYSKQGETLRFLGLPFARVRRVAGVDKAWFGVGADRQILTNENSDDLAGLIKHLETHRVHNAPNSRHDFYRAAPEAWLESILRRNIRLLDANLILAPIYNQFRSSTGKLDLLALRRDGRLVIIELKTQPDREMIFQAADYWRKIELQRRRGLLQAANLFDDREIADKPAIVYLAAPAWSFHRDFVFFAQAMSPEIEIWRFELHENWRQKVKVVARQSYTCL